MSADLGGRLQSVRKRRGLSQKELAAQSGVSLSLIRKIEQGERGDVRLETLRKLAAGLRVRTTLLQVQRDAEPADTATVDLWKPVRRALAGAGEHHESADGAEVMARLARSRTALNQHRYTAIAASLPELLADVDALPVADRGIRSQALTFAGWLLVQTRQHGAAELTLDRAVDSADDPALAASAVNIQCWSLLRQGRIDEAGSLAQDWADRTEPRFSRATHAELAHWGRLWLRVANAAARDNRPGDTADALSLARAAAHRIGREVAVDAAMTRTFGPVTVAHVTAECHMVADEPGRALAIAERTPEDVLQPTGAARLRHRLDIASAHAKLKRPAEAVGELRMLQARAPEWLAQQRYARDILGSVFANRRTLTPDMRQLADAVRLEY